MKLQYCDILKDPEISKLYDVNNNPVQPINHGLKHIKGTINIAKKLFQTVPFAKEIQDLSLIALALHDIKKIKYQEIKLLNAAGQPLPDHAEDSANFALNYLNRKLDEGWEVPTGEALDEIINAIRLHRGLNIDPKYCNNERSAIGDIVYFCDKMDINYDRISEYETLQLAAGKEIGLMYTKNPTKFNQLYQWKTVGNVDIKFNNNTFRVSHNISKDFVLENFIQSDDGNDAKEMNYAINNLASLINATPEWYMGPHDMSNYIQNLNLHAESGFTI